MEKEIMEFSWRGKPIKDIHKWARKHKTDMIVYQHTIIETSFLGHYPTITNYEGEMPELFWDSLTIHQTIYIQHLYQFVRRYKP
jgi:hypothetical protein